MSDGRETAYAMHRALLTAARVAEISKPLNGLAERAAFYRTYLRERDATVLHLLPGAPPPPGLQYAQWQEADGNPRFGLWDPVTNRPWVADDTWAPGPAVTGDL